MFGGELIPGHRRGRPGAIEHHPDRSKIEDDILSRVHFRQIAQRYGMDVASVSRYVNKRMPAHLREAYEREGTSPAADIIAKWRRALSLVERLLEKAAETPGAPAGRLMLAAVDRLQAIGEGILRARGDGPAQAPLVQVNQQVMQITYQQADDWRSAQLVDVAVIPANGNGSGHDEEEA